MERIDLGRVGEYGARSVEFSLEDFQRFGDGTFVLLHKRSEDFAPYVVQNITVIGKVLRWVISLDDTACEGVGMAEIQLHRGDDILAKSDIYQTFVAPSLGSSSPAREIPTIIIDTVAAYAAQAMGYAQQASGFAADAYNSAQAAAESASYSAHPPIIGANNNWWIWNGAEYVDSGHSSMATTYTHTQYSASSEWTINHNLNRYPSVTVVDSAGTKAFGDVTYIDADTLTVSFNAPFSGTAYLN